MKIVKWLDQNFEYICLAALLIVMTVLSFTNVVLRYVFKAPLSWSDEICCYCLALSSFLALPCSIRFRSTIKVDTLTAILPGAVNKVLSLICHALMVVFLIICVKGGFDLAANAASVGQSSPALGIPVAQLYYFMTFCFILSIVRTIQIVVLDITAKKEETK